MKLETARLAALAALILGLVASGPASNSGLPRPPGA